MRPQGRFFYGVNVSLPLVKRTAGKPLTAAELQQRRNAARRRWAAAGLTGVAGAGLGAAAGAVAGSVRAATQLVPRGLRGLYAARTQTMAAMTDQREAIERIFEEQLAGRPAAPPRRSMMDTLESLRVRTPETVQNRIRSENMTRRAAGLPLMTPEEQAARFDELMSGVRTQTPADSATTRRPIVGTEQNKLIYDRAIWQAQRRLRVAERWKARLADPEFGQDARRANVEIRSIQKEIADLERFKAQASTPQARAGSTQVRRGREVQVQATVERKYRRGETLRQVRARIAQERTALHTRRAQLLEMHGRRSARMVAAAERHVVNQISEAVRQHILHASGRGALIGAVAGLTAGGVALLARHVATAGRRQKPIEKLAKADEPEDRAAAVRLARVYRRWIDRLLGRGEDPVHLGDGFVEALGPRITEAYTEGLTSPPITGPDDPRYRIDVDFDLINPAQRRHIAEYALDRIVEITDAQREAIRQAIADQSVMRGIGPIEVARSIKEAIGLTTYQRGVVASFRTQLETLDPRALERQLRDKRFDRTVQYAIERSEPLSDELVDKMVDAYHRKMLALRSRTIARTEALRATSYGGLARAQEVLDRHPELDVTKRWVATHDDRTRPTHMDLDGKEVDGMTGHFVTSAGNAIRWPLDETASADEVINCRCTLQYIFKPKRGQLMAVAA